jgi:hypothetical protein
MEDPLLALQRISNPSGVFLFEKGGKRILLLGDIHSPQERECPRCNPPQCMNYTQIISALDKYHKATSTDLDVFVEISAPDYPDKRGSRFYRGVAQMFNRGLRSLFSKSLDLITSRTELLSKLYFHGSAPTAQRYHYFDFRFTQLFKDYGFDIDAILRLAREIDNPENRGAALTAYRDAIVARYPRKKELLETFKDFLFGKPFDPSYKNRSRLSHGMTRIAKQFYKLESRSERALVRSFALTRLESILKSYKDEEHTGLAIFNALTLLTDIYAICRFLRFFSKQSPGSTSVFLSGLTHSENYADFLKKWGARKHFSAEAAERKCIPVCFGKTRRRSRRN